MENITSVEKIYNFEEPEVQPKESEGLLSPRQMATY